MKNASVAKNLGMTSGRKVSIHPNFLNMIYRGIVVTWVGNIIVTIMMANQIFLPANLSLANA